MADTDTSASIPRRKAAQTASTVFPDQLDSDSQTSGSETKLAESASGNQQPHKRGRYPKGYRSRKATATKAASSSRTSPPQEQADKSGLPPPPIATSKDLCADLNSNENGIDGLSDLTSMSSDEQSSSSDIVVIVSNGTTVLPKPFPMSVAEHPTHMPEASSSKGSRSKGSISKPSQSISAPGPRRTKSNLKPQELDTYVWVLIAPDTGSLYDRETEEEKGLWWPGKIQNPHATSIPIEVKLFGKGTLYLLSTSGNVLPQSAQFNKLKFKNPSYVSPNNVPRKKKQKGEQDGMKNIWQAAVDEMKSDMKSSTVTVDQNVVYELTTTDDEDLPLYVKPNPSSSKTLSVPPTASQLPSISKGAVNRNWGKKRKRTTDDSENSESDVPESSFFRKQDGDGGEADISLEIPGELVLGRSKNQLSVYWPAKIEAYVRPSKPGLPGKYTVTFLDGTKEDIPRNWFYTMIEPQFALCKLGTFESKDPQLMKDNDDEDDVEEEDRSSPVPQDPPPLKEDFLDLSIAQQFVFTKGILRAILEDNYAPSRQKHDDFVKGGKYRRNVTDGALLRGMMNAKDVERLHKIVLKWCLKNYNDDSPEPAAPDDIQRTDQDIELADTILAEPVFDEPKKQDIIMQEPAIFSEPPEKVDADGVVVDLTSNTRLTDYILPESAIRFTSRSPPASSPPPEMPPSSHPVSIIEFPSSQSDIPPTQTSEIVSSPPASSIVPSVFAESSSLCDDAEGDFSDLTPIEEQDEQAVDFSASKRVFVPFKSLGHVVKVEYCSNVLVPEAIRQILLWRSGARTQVGLLSYEQEQLLYEKGQKLLAERDWVFDVVRLREQQLQQIKAEREKQGRKKNGGFSRPKRNATTRNYVE